MLIRDSAAFDRQDVGDANLRICVCTTRRIVLLKTHLRQRLARIEYLLEHRSVLRPLTGQRDKPPPLRKRTEAVNVNCTDVPARKVASSYTDQEETENL